MRYRRVALVFFCLFPCLVFSQETIRLTNGEWSPHLSEHLPHHGFASHVVSEAYAVMGIDVEYSFFPWGRALHNAGKVSALGGDIWHGSVVWIKTPARERRFLFSDRVLTEPQVVFVLKSADKDISAEDYLHGRRVGVTRHAAYPVLGDLEERGLITLERIGNYQMLFKRLLLGRVDAIAMEQQVGRFYLDRSLSVSEKKQVTRLKSHLDERHFHLMLNRHWAESERLILVFNQGLAALKRNGRYGELVRLLNEGYYDRL